MSTLLVYLGLHFELAPESVGIWDWTTFISVLTSTYMKSDATFFQEQLFTPFNFYVVNWTQGHSRFQNTIDNVFFLFCDAISFGLKKFTSNQEAIKKLQ